MKIFNDVRDQETVPSIANVPRYKAGVNIRIQERKRPSLRNNVIEEINLDMYGGLIEDIAI